MTTTEVESRIGMAERTFDRARDQVDQLQHALRAVETRLDKECVEFYRQKTRNQIQRVEADLAKARETLTAAKQDLEAAWALRNPNAEQNREE